MSESDEYIQEVKEITSRTFSGSLEDKIEKYDLRYDYLMEQENEFADSVQEEEDYLTTVQKIIGVKQ